MKERSPRRILWATAIEAGLILLLHLLLLHLAAERGTVATLLAAGPHLPWSALLLAALFVALRLLAVLILPGFVLYRAVLLLFAWRR